MIGIHRNGNNNNDEQHREWKEKDEDGFHTQVDSKKFMIKDESGTTNMTKRVGGLCIGDEIG